MAILVLNLKGPLQSWGVQSRGSLRDTSNHPTKSGVVGVLAAALGRNRKADNSDLCALKMAVRVEEPGEVWSDFQTVTYRPKSAPVTPVAMRNPNDKEHARSQSAKALINKRYLTGAHFTVFLQGDETQLQEISEALRCPVFPLYLGRKNCAPSLPVFADLIGTPENLQEIASTWETDYTGPVAGKRIVIETEASDPKAVLVRDTTVGYRKFTVRAVREETIGETGNSIFGNWLEEL